MTLEEKIAQLETELAKVKAELAERKRTVWKPNDRDPFYYVSNDGSISSKTFTGCILDSDLMDMNNMFEYATTTSQHLKWYNDNVLRVQNRLMQLHELLCPDYFPDWNNNDENKFTIHYDTSNKIWFRDAYVSMNMQTVMFNKEASEKACEILNAEQFMMGDDA